MIILQLLPVDNNISLRSKVNFQILNLSIWEISWSTSSRRRSYIVSDSKDETRKLFKIIFCLIFVGTIFFYSFPYHRCNLIKL